MLSRIAITLSAFLVAGSGQAACFVDYKAKQDDPLRLHYGVMQLEGDCEDEAMVEEEIMERLMGSGWQLLAVDSIFDEDGLEERQDSAGEFFLRY